MNRSIRPPEHWSVQAGPRDVARLEVPADAQRERSFEIYCQLVAVAQPGRNDAQHALRLVINGALEWARAVATAGGGPDGLDVRVRRNLPAGQALKLVASCELRGANRLSLSITVDED